MATYYIATTGADVSNPGTFASPWRSFSYGVSQLFAGDTLFIRGGIYTSSQDILRSDTTTVRSGTSFSNPILVAAYDPGSGPESVTIRPPNTLDGIIVLNTTVSYVIFQDLILDGINQTTGGAGNVVGLSGPAQYIRFLRVEILNGSNFGMQFSSTGGGTYYNELLFCNIHNNGRLGSDNTHGHALYNSNTGNHTISGCLIHDNYGYGLHFYSSSGTHHISNNQLVGNKIYNNGVGSGWTRYGIIINWGENNLIANNLIYGQTGGGVWTDGDSAPALPNKLYNNTIYNHPAEGLRMDGAALVRNNICYSNGVNIADYSGGSTMEFNIVTNPSFVNPSGGDFHLQSTSDAKDTGMTLSEVTTDLDGNSRPQGIAYDKGAYEFLSANVTRILSGLFGTGAAGLLTGPVHPPPVTWQNYLFAKAGGGLSTSRG